jgi:hypothetical protein
MLSRMPPQLHDSFVTLALDAKEVPASRTKNASVPWIRGVCSQGREVGGFAAAPRPVRDVALVLQLAVLHDHVDHEALHKTPYLHPLATRQPSDLRGLLIRKEAVDLRRFKLLPRPQVHGDPADVSPLNTTAGV